MITQTSLRAAASLVTIGFDGPALSDSLRSLLDQGVAGVILFRRNIQNAAQVARLIHSIKSYAARPLYVAIDQEGGRVQRLQDGFTRLPPLRLVGAAGSVPLALRLGELVGRELRAVGVDVNFAPVLDVDTNPLNPVIGDRSFGSDPALVSELGVALGRGMERAHVASCGKHFPGHGDTSQDSHLALPRLSHSLDRLQSVELIPFVRWSEARLASVMTAHVVFEPLDDELPATLSKVVLEGILRRQIGFEGLIFSDDIEMKALADNYTPKQIALLGLKAGVDQFLCCHSAAVAKEFIHHLARGVADSDALKERSNDASRRVMKFVNEWARGPEDFAPNQLRTKASMALIEELQVHGKVRGDTVAATTSAREFADPTALMDSFHRRKPPYDNSEQ